MESDCISLQQLPSVSRTLRIAVVTETYPPEINGVAMTIRQMVAGLQQRQHQVQLIRPRQSQRESAASELNFEEILQRGLAIPRYSNLRFGLPAKQALLRLWSVKRPDVVHLVTEGPLGWSALAAAVKLKIPCSSDFHTNFHSYSKHYGVGWLQKPILGYLRRFHNRAGCTLVPTKSLRADLSKLGYLNLKVVARGVDTRLFHPGKRSAQLRAQWGAGQSDLVAIYVGRLAPEKNLPVVLRAFAEIKKVRKEARLVLVGDGPERAGLQKSHPEHIYAGLRTGEDLAAHYASGDIFLFPSLTETYGNVTVEAMASGLAVIAYRYAAAAEHIQHARNGIAVEVDDAVEFVHLAGALAKDSDRIATLGRRARVAAERIDWECVNDEFEAALREVIDRSDRIASVHPAIELSVAHDS